MQFGHRTKLLQEKTSARERGENGCSEFIRYGEGRPHFCNIEGNHDTHARGPYTGRTFWRAPAEASA